MRDDVARLVQLVEAPVERKEVDWTKVFHDLGTTLPADYVEFIEVCGGGRFEEFLTVLVPSCRMVYFDLVEFAEENEDALWMLWEHGEEKPPQLLEPGARALPWATTSDGDILYWLVRDGQRPDEWTVLVNIESGQWEHFEMGCVEFLAATLEGRVRSELLGDRWPEPEMEREFRSAREFPETYVTCLSRVHVMRAIRRAGGVPRASRVTPTGEVTWEQDDHTVTVWVNRDREGLLRWYADTGPKHRVSAPQAVAWPEVGESLDALAAQIDEAWRTLVK